MKIPQGFISPFTISSGVVLAFTAAAKLVSSFGDAGVLLRPDPIFSISFGHLFQIAAAVELGVAAICFFHKNQTLQSALVAVLATNLLLYRLGLYWVGYMGLCPCLGTLTADLPVSPEVAETALDVIVAYLLVGSYAALFLLLRPPKRGFIRAR
ncbi:MAG: hypothetical protein ACREE6_09890 [Limisphaerales bacterium]